MSRINLYILLSLGTALAASAGQIQIGGANGLTMAYVTAPTAADGCQGACVAGTLGGWGERGYTAALFNNSYTGGANTPNDSSSASSRVPTSSAAPGPNSHMTDNNNGGVTFDLMNDGNNDNFFASINNAGTITIPIGLASIDKVWLMLNDYWGYASATPVIAFNFSSNSATDPSPNLVDTINLTNSAAGLRSSMDCTANSGTGMSCPGITANGAIVAGAAITSAPTPVTDGDATLTTSTIWDGTFNSSTGTLLGAYKTAAGSESGALVLDDTLFNFGSKYSSDYLVSISLTSALPNTAMTNNLSRLALSAITVDQAATPEPSTFILLGTGFGLFGFSRLRRRA